MWTEVPQGADKKQTKRTFRLTNIGKVRIVRILLRKRGNNAQRFERKRLNKFSNDETKCLTTRNDFCMISILRCSNENSSSLKIRFNEPISVIIGTFEGFQ